MATDPNQNTYFSSNLSFEQRVRKTTQTVVVSGTIAAAGSPVWASDWINMAEPGSTVRGEVDIPGTVYAPTVTDGRFMTPVQVVYDNVNNVLMLARIDVSSGRYRCVVRAFNPYAFSIASPNRTCTFYIKEFLKPIA